jgi:hypothetical protein
MEAKLLLIPWLVSVLYSSIPLFRFSTHIVPAGDNREV